MEHRLGDRQAGPASRRFGGMAPRDEETHGGNAARGVIYGALIGSALWVGLLLML